MPNAPRLLPLAVLAARIGATLRQRGETVAVAESAAGGLASAALLAVPGASAFFLGGAVVYSRRAGKALLGLTADDVAGMRAETEPYAKLIAGKMRGHLRASWGLCETGAAGPSGSRYGDAPGHVCVAVAGAVARSKTFETGDANRARNMEVFARHLLALFDETLQAPGATAMPLEAKTIPPCTLAYMRHTGPYGDAAIQQQWADFMAWCRQRGLAGRRTYGFSMDNPSTTPPAQCRYDVAVEVEPGFQPDGAVQVRSFAGGRYACTPFTGTAQAIPHAWMEVFSQALPASGFAPTGEPSLEVYGQDFLVDEKTGTFACWLCVPVR